MCGEMFDIWPYVTSPLVIVGVVLILAFVVFDWLVKREVVSALPGFFETQAGGLLKKHGYLIGVLVALLGLVVTSNALTAAEQKHAQAMIQSEYQKNVELLNQWKQNTARLTQAHREVTERLYGSDNEVLATVFPKISQRGDFKISQWVDTAFGELHDNKVLKNQSKMKQFNKYKEANKGFIHQQLGILSDIQGEDGVIEKVIWEAHQDIFAGIDGKNPAAITASYQQMKQTRQRFNAVIHQTEIYFSEVKDFLGRGSFISNVDVYEVIEKERANRKVLQQFSKELNAISATVKQVASDIR